MVVAFGLGGLTTQWLLRTAIPESELVLLQRERGQFGTITLLDDMRRMLLTTLEQTSSPMPSQGIVLRGGGSTFIRPVLERWAGIYEKQTGVKIEYSAVGSTKGVDGLVSNFLDFGCTDAFLSDEQLAEAGSEILHIPLAIGAVVPVSNLTNDDRRTVGH